MHEQKEYEGLYRQLQEETLSAENHQKLLALIEKTEKNGVERLAALVELAQLRKIAPGELMKQLGFSSLADA